MGDREAGLLKRNLLEVFNQRDDALRRAAVAELYTAEALFFEPEASFAGVDAISARAGEFLLTVPPALSFRTVGEPTRNHEVARLSWTLGPEGGAPVASGQDVAMLEGGRIARLYVFLDA